ncbi:hypothetical protein [Kribbella sp. NPDC049584]|uniref:hypothetical protein n=1 Tax=Kribbella sp. NPDC049584 TaxID=3154833 RepID=UPI00342DB8A3
MPSSLADLFDLYSLRARVYPGLLALAPAVGAVYLIWSPPGFQKIWPAFVGAGGSFLLANLVRGRGNSVEGRLIEDWGGWPTTHALRMATHQNTIIRDRRRKRLEEIADVRLPDLAMERLNPKAADDEYYAATRRLIVLVRAKAEKFPRVQEENTHFGFRRNMYAIKPVALGILTLTLILCAASIGTRGLHWPTAVSVAVALALAPVWAFAVRSGWVRQAGEKYAERLLETLDDPTLTE